MKIWQLIQILCKLDPNIDVKLSRNEGVTGFVDDVIVDNVSNFVDQKYVPYVLLSSKEKSKQKSKQKTPREVVTDYVDQYQPISIEDLLEDLLQTTSFCKDEIYCNIRTLTRSGILEFDNKMMLITKKDKK